MNNPLTYIVLIGLCGMAGIVTGVHMLAGSGWACITGGTMAVLTAALISRGLSNG